MAHRVRHAIAGVLIGLTILAALLAIAQDQETLRVRSALGADEPGAVAYVGALVDTGGSTGNTFDVLQNGDEFFPSMLAAMNGAQHRISFETYIYEKGRIAEQFTSALEVAAARGVTVNLVVDSVGSGSMSDEDLKRLQRAGCRIADFHSATWYQLENINYRTHRKILIADGTTAFVGGAGVADHWLGHAQDKDHWRDTMIRIHGPLARLLEAAFYENFIEAGSAVVTPELTGGVATAAADGDAIVVRGAPTGGSNDLKRLYLLTIALARRTLDITTPYFLTDESSMWALHDAVQRGVHIRVLMEGDRTDARPVKYASRSAYDELLSSGIELYEYQPTMMHTKAMVVDGAWTVFGSANFDNRSLELNDELNIAVSSRDLATRLTAMFEADLRASKRIDLDEWRHRPWLERTREHVWTYFGEIF